MQKKTGLKRLAALLASLVLLCALALPGVAAEGTNNADEVTAQLERLLSVDINWRWLPDIEHNEQAVQSLLDAYLACTADERAAFTPAQNEDLYGYFQALYTVQGKDVAEVDALFDGSALPPPSSSSQSGSQTSSQPPDSSSDSGSASGSESQSQPESSSSSQPQSSSASQPASSQPDASQSASDLPVISNPPQTPGGDGWTALLGNNALGVIVVAVLLLLVIVLFLRFLVSLRKAGKPSRADADAAARAQELFGEDYDEDALPDSPPPVARQAADDEDDEDEDDKPVSRRQQRLEEKRARDEARAEAQAAKAKARAAEDAGDEDENDDPFAGKPDKPEAPAARQPDTKAAKAPKPAPPVDKPGLDAAEDKKTVVAPGGDVFVQSSTSRDPDAPNAISMRSFSSQPRTGRPAKMTFRQGEPGDIDAIDE